MKFIHPPATDCRVEGTVGCWQFTLPLMRVSNVYPISDMCSAFISGLEQLTHQIVEEMSTGVISFIHIQATDEDCGALLLQSFNNEVKLCLVT